MADYMIAEEKDLIALPDQLSLLTVLRLRVAWGRCTKLLKKIGVNGNHSVLITGLGTGRVGNCGICVETGCRDDRWNRHRARSDCVWQTSNLCDFVLNSRFRQRGSGQGTYMRFLCGARVRLLCLCKKRAPQPFEQRANGGELLS